VFTKGASTSSEGVVTDTELVRSSQGSYELWTGFTTGNVGVILIQNATFGGPMIKAPTGLPSVGSIGIGDLDGDDIFDVVATSYNSGTIAVLLRNSSGGLGPATPYPIPVGSTDAVVIDWDADGDKDVLVSLYLTNKIAVFLNQGNGVLGTATTIDTGMGPNGITAVDPYEVPDVSFGAYAPGLSGPGARAVGVTANFVDGTSSVVSSGSCSLPSSSAADGGPVDIVVRDVTSDGRLDLITLNQSSGSVSVNVAGTRGIFGAPMKTPVGANPLSLSLIDFNLDGGNDVLVTNHVGSTGGVSIYRGNGTGTFIFAANLYPELGAGGRVETGDFDGDGKPDILLARPFGADSFFDIFTNLTPVCGQTSNGLCIGSRFRIEVDWSTAQGGGLSGAGTAVPGALQGFKDGGLFWFFNPENPEMLVKVLNGCATNNRFWVFSAATTNVSYTLTVTDSKTGTVKTYFNPDSTPAPAIQDTEAFATCP